MGHTVIHVHMARLSHQWARTGQLQTSNGGIHSMDHHDASADLFLADLIDSSRLWYWGIDLELSVIYIPTNWVAFFGALESSKSQGSHLMSSWSTKCWLAKWLSWVWLKAWRLDALQATIDIHKSILLHFLGFLSWRMSRVPARICLSWQICLFWIMDSSLHDDFKVNSMRYIISIYIYHTSWAPNYQL